MNDQTLYFIGEQLAWAGPLAVLLGALFVVGAVVAAGWLSRVRENF